MLLCKSRFISFAVLAVILWSIVNTLSAPAYGNPPQANNDGVRRMTPEEARELLKHSKAVLVDVRGESSYKAGHIKGALFIPFAEIRNRAKELPKNKMILTYCS